MESLSDPLDWKPGFIRTLDESVQIWYTSRREAGAVHENQIEYLKARRQGNRALVYTHEIGHNERFTWDAYNIWILNLDRGQWRIAGSALGVPIIDSASK